MKKKINPKNQTKDLAHARWEFLRRNPEDMAKYEEIDGASFRAFCKKMRISDVEAEDYIKGSFALPAAFNHNLTLFESWIKVLHKLKDHPLNIKYEEKQEMYREQILKDAKQILNQIIFQYPSESLVITVDLNRSRESIMAEVEKIITDELNNYHEQSNKIFLFDVNNKFVRTEQNDKKKRMKWLSIIDELLEVWDLYDQAGQQPVKITFKQIAKKVNRPLSTVKDQWRTAYEKIYGIPYNPESKYVTEEKKANADQLCPKCPHGAKCYRGNGWFPCNDYLKIAGKEKSIKFTEYRENIFYKNSDIQ